MLQLERVTKRYGVLGHPAIEDIDLTVDAGEIVGLVGRNGAGKTTAIRVAVGLLRPTWGSARVDGFDTVTDKRRASAHVGWVPELFPYDPSPKALSLLRFYAGFNGLRGSIATERAEACLESVGLGGYGNRPVRTFSQGMKRRFGIAAAMLHDPTTLLLDEILNGLDPEGIALVRNWLIAERRNGKAILLSSHLLGELEVVADRVAFMQAGHLIRVVGRAELRSAGPTRVRLVILNLDDAAIPFLHNFGEVTLSGNQVFLTGCNVEPAELNLRLTMAGYRVQEIAKDEASLEEYFFQLLEESA